MRKQEAQALATRASKYMQKRMGYSPPQLSVEQAGNQLWRHMAAFARREVDREARERRIDKAEYRYFAKQVLDRWGVQHVDKIIDEIFGATSARGKGTERT